MTETDLRKSMGWEYNAYWFYANSARCLSLEILDKLATVCKTPAPKMLAKYRAYTR